MRVVELKSAKAIVGRRRLQRKEWCPALTMDQFLTREEALSGHYWARERMQTWILIQDDVHPEEDELHNFALASLETFRLDVVMGPKEERGTAYGVGTVFTAEELRGKGYASELCRQILTTLENIDSHALAAVLYSDVGPSIYSKCGFFVAQKNPKSFFLGLGPEKEKNKILAQKATKGVERLTRDKIGPIVDKLCEEVASSYGREEAFTILPTSGQVSWLLEREHVVAATCHVTPLPSCGALIGGSWGVWTADMSKGKNFVKILLLKVGDVAEEAASVLASAILSSSEQQVDEGGVVLWGPGSVIGKWPISHSLLEGAGIMFEEKERKGSLPMLAPLHPNVRPEFWKFIPQAIWL